MATKTTHLWCFENGFAPKVQSLINIVRRAMQTNGEAIKAPKVRGKTIIQSLTRQFLA
jgi:hypothetical protein